ncbi:MAG TPA: hypothetical protein VEF91_05830 [Verrucomicrobiae bacterium]|nr:hypothetical protein [Verrucomicrobiae bacterium]
MSEQKRKILLSIVLASVMVILLSGVSLSFSSAQQRQSLPNSNSAPGTAAPSQGIGAPAYGPNIFATVAFPRANGFMTVIHPTKGTIEFVLSPKSMGQITVSYNSTNNLASFSSSFTNPVPAWTVDLSTGSVGSGSGLNVTYSGLTWVSIHQVVVNYTITSGSSNGLYVLGLPSTMLTTIVDVGTQPYTGPLTWLNGTVYY